MYWSAHNWFASLKQKSDFLLYEEWYNGIFMLNKKIQFEQKSFFSRSINWFFIWDASKTFVELLIDQMRNIIGISCTHKCCHYKKFCSEFTSCWFHAEKLTTFVWKVWDFPPLTLANRCTISCKCDCITVLQFATVRTQKRVKKRLKNINWTQVLFHGSSFQCSSCYC